MSSTRDDRAPLYRWKQDPGDKKMVGATLSDDADDDDEKRLLRDEAARPRVSGDQSAVTSTPPKLPEEFLLLLFRLSSRICIFLLLSNLIWDITLNAGYGFRD